MSDPDVPKLTWRESLLARPGLWLCWRGTRCRIKTRRQMRFEEWLWKISDNDDLAAILRQARIEEYGR